MTLILDSERREEIHPFITNLLAFVMIKLAAMQKMISILTLLVVLNWCSGLKKLTQFLKALETRNVARQLDDNYCNLYCEKASNQACHNTNRLLTLSDELHSNCENGAFYPLQVVHNLLNKCFATFSWNGINNEVDSEQNAKMNMLDNAVHIIYWTNRHQLADEMFVLLLN